MKLVLLTTVHAFSAFYVVATCASRSEELNQSSICPQIRMLSSASDTREQSEVIYQSSI